MRIVVFKMISSLTEQPKRFEGVDNIVNACNGTGKGSGCGYRADAFPALRGHAEESYLCGAGPQIQRPALHGQPCEVAPIERRIAGAEVGAIAGPGVAGDKLTGAVIGQVVARAVAASIQPVDSGSLRIVAERAGGGVAAEGSRSGVVAGLKLSTPI